MVACICHSPLHHQKPDFEGQSVIKASSYLLPFVLEAHRESLPRSCETSARRLSAESAEVYSTADLLASAAHIPFSYSPNVSVDGLPWSDVFSILTCPRGCIIKRGMLDFLSEDKTKRNYYCSDKNKTEKPSDEPPTDQDPKPGVRADQAHRARLIAKSIVSYGCLSLVKFVFFLFFFYSSILK